MTGTTTETIRYGNGFSTTGTRIPLEFWGSAEGRAVTAERQDRAFSQALGGTLRQLGIEKPHAEGSGYLRPGQIADLIALRGGADSGAVLGGASAPMAPAQLFGTPFGQWPLSYKLGAAVGILAALALLAGALRR